MVTPEGKGERSYVSKSQNSMKRGYVGFWGFGSKFLQRGLCRGLYRGVGVLKGDARSVSYS